jgi:hypothetical protein
MRHDASEYSRMRYSQNAPMRHNASKCARMRQECSKCAMMLQNEPDAPYFRMRHNASKLKNAPEYQRVLQNAP